MKAYAITDSEGEIMLWTINGNESDCKMNYTRGHLLHDYYKSEYVKWRWKQLVKQFGVKCVEITIDVVRD